MSAFGNLSGGDEQHRAEFHRFYQKLMAEIRANPGRAKGHAIDRVGMLYGMMKAHYRSLSKAASESEYPNFDMAMVAHKSFVAKQD